MTLQEAIDTAYVADDAFQTELDHAGEYRYASQHSPMVWFAYLRKVIADSNMSDAFAESRKAA